MTDPSPPDRSPEVPPAQVQRLVAAVECAGCRPILARCLAGEVSPQVTLAQLVYESGSAAEVRRAIDQITAETDADSRATDSIVRDRVDDLTQLLVEHEEGVTRVVRMVERDRHAAIAAAPAEERLDRVERLFDSLVGESEEASVAVYSLGSAELLEQATREVVDVLEHWGVLGSARTVLQIGCGIGRFERAITGRVRAAYGVDVSTQMVRTARRRCAGLSNVYLEKTSGRDLSLFAPEQFDLVYAVDTFPYLVQAGGDLVARHFAEVARVLKPGGDFVILNYSYRGDVAADCADVRQLTASSGFELLEEGTRPFTLWDGVAFRMRRRTISESQDPSPTTTR